MLLDIPHLPSSILAKGASRRLTARVLQSSAAPAASRPRGDLLEWAGMNYCTPKSRCSLSRGFFAHSDLVERIGSDRSKIRFNEWPLLESWLRVAQEEKVHMNYDVDVGFGLIAQHQFDAGEVVVGGF